MAVYLIPLDDSGKKIEDVKIYPQNQKYENKNGDRINIKIFKDDCKDKSPIDDDIKKANSVSLEYGKNYILGVDGKDIRGNEILPSLDGKEYRICFKAKKQAPELKIESPVAGTSYIAKGQPITISGTTSIPDDHPTITITCKKGNDKEIEVYTYKVTDNDIIQNSEENEQDNLIYYNFEYPVPLTGNGFHFEQDESKQYTFEITSELDGWKTSISKTIIYDVDGPTISIDSMLPTAEKYDAEKEDGIPESGSYLNGDVKMKIAILDDYDSVNTEIKDPEDDRRPKFIITDKDDNPIAFRVENETEKFPVHYISTPTKQEFTIHTEDIPNGKIKVKIFAEDRAGNLGVDIDDLTNTSFVREYIVDQSTDAPVILPYNPASVTLKYATAEDIDNAFATADDAKEIKSVFTTGSTLQLKLIDDDGIESVTFKRGEKDTDENLEEKTGKTETQAGNPTELMYTYQLPTVIGKFKCSVTVKDTKNSETTKTFWIVTTGAAPVVSITSAKPDNKIITLASENTEANAQKKITEINLEIDSGYKNFTVSRFEKINGTEVETVLFGNDGILGKKLTFTSNSTSKTFTDSFEPSPNRSENKIRYVVTDEVGHSGEREFSYNVDNTAPVVDADTIVVPSVQDTEGLSFRFKSGTASDTAPAGEKESGIAKIQFTFDSAKASANIKTLSGISALNETVLFGDDEYEYAFGSDAKEGKRKIYVRAIDEVGNIGSWVEKEFVYDTSKPNLSITSYKQNGTDFVNFADNTTEFDITDEFALGGKVSDDYGIKNFEIWQKKEGSTYENSYGIKLLETANPNKSWTIDKLPRDESNPDNANVDSGSYIYTIVATDKADKSTTKTITANIDITKPIVTFDTATASKMGQGAINSSPFMFSGTVIENTPKISGIYYKVVAKTNPESAVPAAPSSTISELLTASKWTAAGWTSVTPEASWSFYRDIATGEPGAIAEGKYYLYMYAVDGAGNVSERAKQEFHVDMASPVITATAPEYVNSLTNASGSAADLRKVVISGTIVETNELLSFTISRNGTTSSITPDENGNWTFIDNPANDGKYTYTIKATDLVGKTDTITKNVTVDTSKPVYTADSLKVGSKNWNSTSYYKDTTLKMSGTYTDATSGIDTLFYYIQYPGRSGQVPADLTAKVNGNIVADGEVSLKANSADSTQYDFNFTVVDYKNNAETPNTLYIQTIDNAGNKSDVKAFSINIDTSAPELTALYYKVGEGTIKEASGTVYVNGTLPITVYGNYKDAESGAEPLTGFKINGTSIAADVSYSASTISSATDIPASFGSYSSADSKAIRSWKAVFTPAMDGKFEFEGRNGTYDESVSLTGGKTAVNPFKITLDTKGPSISNVSITPSNNTVAYKKTESNGTVNYYVNNQAGTTFTFAGVSADSTGVDTVKLEVFNSDNTKTYSETTRHSEWSFTDVDLSALTGTQSAPSKVTITVTDIAGNSTTQELHLVFDTTAPKAMHWADANNKDIYFRIGSDTGSKYSYGSWGNDSTIEIRGTFDEASTGSGLKAIHYAIFDAVPTSEQISAFEAGTLTVTGSAKIISSFAPLSTADTQTVSYSTNTSGGRASKTVTTNFRTTLSGFNGQNNYLVLVAEDNVGNRAADTLVVNDGSTEGTNSWNSNAAYYSINKDTQAPSITSNATNLYTNGTGSDIIISGTASDALSGLANVTLTIEEINFSREITEFTGTAGNEWSTTIPVSNFAADTVLNGKTYTVYAKATDNAGVGNSKQISAGTIVVDKKAPAVKINSSASVTKDKVTFSGTVNDGTGAGLASSNMILYYTKSSTLGDVTEVPTALTTGTSATDAETKWVQLATIAPSTDWSLADVDLTEITGGDANTTLYFTIAAKDAAGTGNTGYANPCSILVDRNKPVLTDASSGIGTKLGSANVNNVWFNSKTLKLSGAYTDEGGSGVTTISYQINTAAKKDIQTTDGSYDVNISDFVDGSNTVTIWAKDKVGIESEHTTYTFNIDSVVPVIASIDGAETTKTTDVALTINITDKNPVAPTVVVKDANSTTVLKTLTANTPTGSDSAYTSTVTIPFASEITTDGFYDIEVTVKDKADNTSAVFTKRIVRDHVAPTITITKPASESGDFIKSTNYKFEGTITDATCGIETATAALYKVTGNTEEQVGEIKEISLDASGNWVFQAYELDAADYKVKINATDIAGNAADETESPIVKIDSVPPKVTVSSTGLNYSTGSAVEDNPLSNGITYYANGNYSIKVKVEDLNYVYAVTGDYSGLTEITAKNNSNEDLSLTKSVSIDGDDNTVITINPSAYTDGLFTYTIKVGDKAGNKADDVIIKVHRDTTGPSVEIKNPTADITDPKKSLDADTYSFRINANDGSGVGVSFLYYLFSTSLTAPGTSEAAESAWDGGAFTDGDKIIEMDLEDNKDAQTSVKKTKLCEGTWYLHSWAKDKSGNKSSVSTRKFSIDKAVPVLSVTQALNEGSRNVITVGSTGYALSGTVSDSNELASLVLKVDGVNTTITPASGTAWSTTIATGSDNGKIKSDESVELELTATDIAGKSTTKKFTLYNDTKNPELEITAPVLNEPVATLGKVIKGTASDDGYGIDKVDYKLYRGLVSSANEATATVVTSEDKDVTSENFPVEIKGEQWYIEDSTNGMPLGTPEGQLTLKVTATEKMNGTYGGGSTSKYVSFYFDKANPNLEETGVGTTGKTTNTTFTLSGTASDSNALASVTINWKVDETDKSITLNPTTENWSQEFVVGTANRSANNYVADGANEFTIIATDITGKTKQLTRTVTVDTQKPTVGDITVTTTGTAVGTATWYKTSNIEVTVAVSENGLSGISKVEYQAEDGTWTPLSFINNKYQGTIRFTGDGAKTFNIKATDVAGNVSEEATASVNIDTSAPELSALYYKKGTDDAQSITSPVYLQSGTQITVYGNYKDEQSGVKALAFKLGSASVTPTVTYSTTEIENSAPVDSNYSIVSTAITGKETTIRSWKAVFTPSTSGAFVVTGDNRTTNPTSETKIFDITIDDTAPTVQIKTPAVDITDGKNALNGTSYTFSVNASDGIGVGVANLQYAFSKNPSSPAATEWETIPFAGGDKSIEMPLIEHTTETRESGKVTELCEGTWYLYVKATDKAGNVNTTPVKRTFKVDMAAPTLTIPTAIQEGKRNVISSEVGTNGYVLSGTVSDTNALTSLVLKVDNVETTITPASGTAWTATIAKGTTDGKLKSDESVEVELIATDIAGKTTTKNFILYYDTKDPELEITAPVADEPVETDGKVIKGTVSDDGYGIDKVEYKLYSGVVTSANEATATVVTSDTKQVTSTNFPVEIKGEQWYIKTSTGMPLGTAEGSLTLKVTATEKKNGTYGGRSTSKYVSFYFDKANPNLDETGIGSAGKTTNTGFTLGGKVWDSNAIANLTIKCGNKTWVSGTDSNITINPTTSEPTANNWTATFVVGEETSTNTNAANPNNIADGTNEFTIIAKDISGKEKQLTRTVIVDTVAPTCGTPSITSTGKEVGTGTDAKTWYNTSFINIKLENVKDENGTGISKVEYTTETGDSAKWYPMSDSGTTYTATVNCTSQGLNSIRVKVTDAAGTTGNETAAGTKDVYIDTNAPTLGTSKVKYLTGDFAAVSELLINASNGYQLQIEASDTEDENADDYSGIASVTYSYGSKTIAGTKSGNYWIIEVPITGGNGTNNYSDTKTNAIYAIIKDNAGNEIKERILTVTKDKTDPKVEIVSFTRAGSKTDGVDDINGTITISGTASDTNKFGSVKLEYQKDGETGWTEIATKTDNSWTTTLNTKTLDDNTKYTIKATAIDAAGNTKAVTQDVYVNQDSDRPVITVTNMSLATAANETSFLKRTSRLEGTVSDDDGNVSKLEYSTNGTSWTEATLEYGTAWSIPDLPEGDNKLYFRVTDKVNTTPFTTAVEVESATAEAANQPKIKDQNNTYVSHIQGSLALKFKVVTKQPDVDAKQYQVFNSSTNAWETRETLGTLGGIYTKFKISLKAKSEAFIGAVQAKYATGNYDINFTCVDTNYSDKEYHTWTSTEIALDASKTEIKLKISDASSTTDPMTLEQTITYAVDNTTPEITIKEPASTVGVKETMQFDIKEEAVTYYAVTKNDVTANAQTGAPDSENIAWTQIEDTSNGLTRYVFFDDDINVKDHTDRFALYLTEATTEKPNRLSITTVAAIDSPTNPFETITKVKFWVKAVDNCGNIGYASKEVNVDPQGNRPTVTLGYPADVLKDGVYVVPTLGGTIRLDGNVSDDIAAKYVWVKIERENADFSGADVKFLKGKEYPIGDMTTNELLADATITALADNASVPNYAIRVPVSGTGWNLSINNNQEFNVANNEAHLKFKIYATDADQDKVDPNIKHIHRSAEITQQIVIDSRTPYISASELRLVKYENGSTSDQQYNDGASVHGIWYLQGKIRDDDSGLKTVQFKKNSDTTYTDVITAVGQNIDKYNNDSHFYFKKIDHTDNSTAQVKKYDYEFSVPLGNSTSGQVGTDTITIKAIEATDQNLYVEQTYSVTYDNKAPEFNTDTENPFVKLASEIYNSSGFYTFGAIASEDAVEIDNKTVNQSGVERIAFYFTRDLEYGLNQLDSAVYTKHSGTSTHDLFDVMIYHSNVDSEDVDSGNMIVGYQSGLTYSNGLYWRSYSGTSSGKTFTYTNTTVDPNIHAGGLVKIGGVIYKIESVSGKTISVASNISGTSADFALCNVIDKGGEKNGTSVSSVHGYGFGYYPSRSTDDGDLITETFNSQGTSYIFDASINSKNLPDGPITLHMIAFDKAGNVTEPFTMTGTVKNNAPRIAGLILGTDENGNGSVDEEEFVSAYSGKYNKGYDTTGNEMHDVKFPVISAGQTQTSLLTVKGLTVVKPEIIGGNGAISYSYKVGSKYAVDGGNLKKDGSTDNVNGTTDDVVTGSITLPVSAFIGTEDGKDNALIPDGELSEFKFTFGDSTPGTSLTDTTGKNSATMTVYIDVALRETNKAKNWILPFYWKSKTDNSLFKQSADEGHIELAADWVTTTSYSGTTGEYDADPKVSGKIKIEGIAQDDTLLREIKVKFGKSMGGMTTADTTIATYDFASGKWGTVTGTGESQTFTAFGASEPATIPDSGWVSYVKQATYQDLLDAKIITAMPSDKEASSKVPYASQDFGHVVHWILYLDTAKVAGVAATDVTVTATATDRGTPKWNSTTNAPAYSANAVSVTGDTEGEDETTIHAANSGAVTKSDDVVTIGALTGRYRMDVVPYITEVVRGTDDSTKPNKFNTNRARSGAVSLRRGDILNKIKGFNLNGASVSVKITPNKNGSGTAVTMADVTAGNDITFTVSDSTKSGYLHVEVNSITAMNNVNCYKDYNSETNTKAYDHNTLTDDRYVHIWRVSQQDTFKGSKNAVYPAMARGSDGTLYASFTNYGQSKTYYTKSFIGTGTVDASNYKGVKSSTSWMQTTYSADDSIQTNGVATLFWGYDPPEETAIAVGSNGEVNVFYAANYHGGSANDWNDNSVEDAGGIYVYDTDAKDTQIQSNGTNTKRAKMYRSELYTYDDELNQFKNLRIIRSGNYIYLAYYDRLRGSIKTSVINDSNKPDTSTNGLPWITLDGDSDNVDKAGTGYSFAGGWTPFLNTNYANGVSARTSATGESVAITTNSSGYPVVFYMDAETGCLRIATASKASPTTANDWRVQGVFASTDDNYDTASDYMSCLVDSQGYLHIAFQNTKGQLVYAKSTNNPSNGTTAYTFGSSEVLDDSGMYIDMTMNGTTPYISYLSRVNSYDGMKIAFKDSNFDENNDGVAEGGWETMTAALNEKVTTVRTCIEPNAKAYDTNSYTAAVGFCPGLDYRAAFYVGQ